MCISRCRQAARYISQRDTKATKIKDFLIVSQLFKRKQWFPCFYVSYPKHNSMKSPQKINKQKTAVVRFLPLKSVLHIILGLHHLQKLQKPKIWSKYCTFHRAEWYFLWQTKVKTKLWKEACDWEEQPPLPALTWKWKYLSPTLRVSGFNV